MSVKIKRVAIDTGPLNSGHSVRGIGVNTRELMNGFKKLDEKDFIIGRDKIKIEAVDFSKTDLSKFDIVHYPYFHPFFPIIPPSKPAKKVVLTIHDLIPLIYPKNYPSGLKGKLNLLIQKKRLKYVDAIITISETSKKDIIKFLGVPSQKVHVIYLAQREIFKQIKDRDILDRIKRKYKLPNKFVLYVGDVNYNKNIPTLIKACKLIRTPLVIVGKQARNIESMRMELMDIRGPRDWIRFLFNKPHPELAHYETLLNGFKNGSDIYRLGFVPDEDLVAIHNLASVYVQPSYYEGFGLPLLETMASGTPVVASKIGAHKEIAGDAVLYFNPKSVKNLVRVLKKVLGDRNMRERLIENGFKKSSEYSWEKTVKEVLDVYKKVLATN